MEVGKWFDLLDVKFQTQGEEDSRKAYDSQLERERERERVTECVCVCVCVCARMCALSLVQFFCSTMD